MNDGVRLLREFSGNVAHELRTPLAGIRAVIAEEMKKSFPEPVELTPEKKRALTEQIHGIVTKLQGVK